MSGDFPNWHVSTESYRRWIDEIESPALENLPPIEGPCISIVMATFNTSQNFLCEALDSILRQHYTNWQLCIADDCSTESHVQETLARYAASDDRVELHFRSENGGISCATNDALALTRGDYIAFMDHDDVLPDHALHRVVVTVDKIPATKLLYSDSDHIGTDGQRCRPYFKPDWNYELLLGQNYLNHLSVYRGSLLRELGGLGSNYDGSQDYDLVLRAVERLSDNEITHLPEILYHWRDVDSSVSRSNMAQAVHRARAAVQDHLERSGQTGEVKAARQAIVYNRVQWPLPQPTPRVLLALHGLTNPENDDIAAALDSSCTYPNYTLRKISADEVPGSKIAAHLNALIEASDADLVCIVDAGLAAGEPGWLETLVAIGARNHVGCVAPRIIDMAGMRNHGPSVLLPTRDGADNIMTDSYWGASGDGKGYYSALTLDRNVAIVAGRLLVFRRQAFLESGGLDENLSHWELLGADLALSLQSAGLKNIWTAQREFSVSGEKTQPPADAEKTYFSNKWSGHDREDGNYNTGLLLCREYEKPDIRTS